MNTERLADQIMEKIACNAIDHGFPKPKMRVVNEDGTPMIRKYKYDESDIFYPVTEEYLKSLTNLPERHGQIYVSPVEDSPPLALPAELRTTTVGYKKNGHSNSFPFSARTAQADRRSHLKARRGPGRYK